MFSANENIALRQHKRRIVEYVEDLIPPDVLEKGATCMVMQVSCKAPGCVPLETVIMIIFPSFPEELIPGIVESKDGGTLKTKVLLPMADISRDNVLESLPPPLGTRTLQKLCFQARDVMLAQITQLMGDDDLEGRGLMADYLQECLEEYKKRDCVAPEYGAPFQDDEINESDVVAEEEVKDETKQVEKKPAVPAGNFVFRREPEDNGGGLNIMAMKKTEQPINADDKNAAAANESKTSYTRPSSTMDWRRQQNVERTINASSQSIISRLSEREHAPGVRMAGCPCCDPDNVNNYVDSMMML